MSRFGQRKHRRRPIAGAIIRSLQDRLSCQGLGRRGVVGSFRTPEQHGWQQTLRMPLYGGQVKQKARSATMRDRFAP